jgi:hypothetical protein
MVQITTGNLKDLKLPIRLPRQNCLNYHSSDDGVEQRAREINANSVRTELASISRRQDPSIRF